MKKLLIAVAVLSSVGNLFADEYVVTVSSDPAMTRTPIKIVATSNEGGAIVVRTFDKFYEVERGSKIELKRQYLKDKENAEGKIAEVDAAIAAMDKAVVDAGGKAMQVQP